MKHTFLRSPVYTRGIKHLNKIYLRLFISMAVLFSFIASADTEDKPTLVSESVDIHFGFSNVLYSDVDLKDAQIALEYWINLMISDKEHYKAKTTIYYSLDSMLNAIKSEAIDTLTLSSLEYLRIKDKINMEPVLVGAFYDGSPMEKYLLLIRKDSQIKNLKDLKGKKLMLEAGSHRIISQLWIDTLLLKEGLPESKDFFLPVKVTQKASQAVLPVFFNQADACIVTSRTLDTMIELNPQVGFDLIALKNSQELLPAVFCFTKKLSDYVRNYILNSALKLDKEPEAKQTLVLYHVDKIIPFKDSYLDNIVALVKEYDELKQNITQSQ